jgi:hypothetical protein
VAAAGDATPKGSDFDVAPEDESLTVMLAVPGLAINELDMEAVRMAFVPKVVESGVPFHWTTEDAVKPLPFT